MTFGKCWFSIVERTILKIGDPNIQEKTTKNEKQKHVQNLDAQILEI